MLARHAELPSEDWTGGRIAHVTLLITAVPVCAHRGLVDEARRMVEVVAQVEDFADVQERCQYGFAQAQLLHAAGQREQALDVAEAVLVDGRQINLNSDSIKECLALAIRTALELGEPQRLEPVLRRVEELAPGQRSRFVNAQLARFRAAVGAGGAGPDATARSFERAELLLREIRTPFHLGVVEFEHAEWLESEGRATEAEPLRTAAARAFERLEAAPQLLGLGGATDQGARRSLTRRKVGALPLRCPGLHPEQHPAAQKHESPLARGGFRSSGGPLRP